MKTKRIHKMIAAVAGLLLCIPLVQAQENTATITVSHNEKGKVLFDGRNISSYGTVTAKTDDANEFILVPDEGYFIKEILFNGESALELLSAKPVPGGNSSAHYFYTPLFTEDSEMEVIFVPQVNNHQVVVSCNFGGKVVVNGKNVNSNLTMTIGEGDMITFKITPNYRYGEEVYYNGRRVHYVKNGTIGGTLTLGVTAMDRKYGTQFYGDNPACSIWEVIFTPPDNNNDNGNGGGDDNNGNNSSNITTKIAYNEGGKVLLDGEEILENTYTKGYNKFSISIIPDVGMKVTGFSWNGLPYFFNSTGITNHEFNNAHFDMNFSVTFGEIEYYEVATSYSEGGKVLINDQDISADIIKEGEQVAFTIHPEEGYYIEDVTFEDKSVMDQLIWTNAAKSQLSTGSPSATYISPSIMEQSGLNVLFAASVIPADIDDDFTVSVDATDNSQIKVYTASGMLIVENIAAGEVISIYSQTGACVKTGQANGNRMEIQLSAGMYIVKAGKKMIKVIL